MPQSKKNGELQLRSLLIVMVIRRVEKLNESNLTRKSEVTWKVRLAHSVSSDGTQSISFNSVWILKTDKVIYRQGENGLVCTHAILSSG